MPRCGRLGSVADQCRKLVNVLRVEDGCKRDGEVEGREQYMYPGLDTNSALRNIHP